jgi:hypothetical protein
LYAQNIEKKKKPNREEKEDLRITGWVFSVISLEYSICQHEIEIKKVLTTPTAK